MVCLKGCGEGMKKIIAVLLVLVILLISCAVVENDEDVFVPRPMPQTHPLTVNEDGNYVIIEPLNLLMGKTEEEWVEDALAYERFDELAISMEVYAGGGVLLVITENMLNMHVEALFNGGLLHTREYVQSIRNVVYENELLSEISVFVDVDLYHSSILGNERLTANLLLAVWAGNFQLLSGVLPDEWHTTITVRCYDTNALVSRTEFPFDGMFERRW